MMENEENFEHIEFPYPISEEKLKEIFGHLGRELPALVQYSAETRGRVGIGRFEEGWTDLERRVITQGSVQFRECFNTLTFNVVYRENEENESNINYRGIRFDTIPGYGREELLGTHSANPDDMDKVKRCLDEYFVDLFSATIVS